MKRILALLIACSALALGQSTLPAALCGIPQPTNWANMFAAGSLPVNLPAVACVVPSGSYPPAGTAALPWSEFQPSAIFSTALPDLVYSIFLEVGRENDLIAQAYTGQCTAFESAKNPNNPVPTPPPLLTYGMVVVPTLSTASGYSSSYAGHVFISTPLPVGAAASPPCAPIPTVPQAIVFGEPYGYSSNGQPMWQAVLGTQIANYATFTVPPGAPPAFGPGVVPTYVPAGLYQVWPVYMGGQVFVFLNGQAPLAAPAQ